MKRTDYVYIARRIDTEHPQNLGDYEIYRRPTPNRPGATYHYDSKHDWLRNRGAENLNYVGRGSRIYQECIRAIDRLKRQEGTDHE